jgi:hypothetical protein
MRYQALGILTLALFTACRDAEEASPEALAARRDATRDACIGAELAQSAEANLNTLESSLGGAAGSPLAQAGRAALAYARAYYQHAQLRAAAYAYADSALNYAVLPVDSQQFMETSTQYATRSPEPGTLEANVVDAYLGDFAALRADEDHPCNWTIEE